MSVRVEIYNENKLEETIEKAQLSLTTAYYTEAFQRTKELEDLSYYIDNLEQSYKKLLNKEENKAQTQDQMLNQIKVLNAAYGGNIVYVE